MFSFEHEGSYRLPCVCFLMAITKNREKEVGDGLFFDVTNAVECTLRGCLLSPCFDTEHVVSFYCSCVFMLYTLTRRSSIDGTPCIIRNITPSAVNMISIVTV